MRILPAAALVTAALLLFPPASSPQSLGEIAAREKEKRKSSKPAKVYTERDLRTAGAGGTVSATESGAPAEAETAASGAKEEGKGGAPKGKTEEEVQAEQAKAWREKLQKANENVSKLQADADRLQVALNDLTGNIYGSQRTALLSKLEEVKKQIAAAKQAVADLEDEGRRSRFR